jgi:hypothetical protein
MIQNEWNGRTRVCPLVLQVRERLKGGPNNRKRTNKRTSEKVSFFFSFRKKRKREKYLCVDGGWGLSNYTHVISRRWDPILVGDMVKIDGFPDGSSPPSLSRSLDILSLSLLLSPFLTAQQKRPDGERTTIRSHRKCNDQSLIRWRPHHVPFFSLSPSSLVFVSFSNFPRIKHANALLASFRGKELDILHGPFLFFFFRSANRLADGTMVWWVREPAPPWWGFLFRFFPFFFFWFVS